MGAIFLASYALRIERIGKPVTTPKEKISLEKEQETLLIPLYAKAQDNPILVDEKARQILTGIEYDFEQLKIPQKTVVTLLMRAKQLDAYTADFIGAHPDALILHLGCGLDSRYLRVRPGNTLWIDLDLPGVIELRRKFYAETETYRMIASSVTDLRWAEQVPAERRPVFVVAEGLLMYLQESEVRDLMLCLHRKFPGGGMAFDAFSKMTADRVQAHPSLQKTGAAVHWGIDDPHEIERWTEGETPGIRLKEEWFFSQSPDIARLGWFYHLMFRLTATMQTVQRAQRLLVYQL
jgi:O-methyltransferase involved in polyketide biosynthesis